MANLRSIFEGLISRLPARLQPMARWRFVKFGAVGASGTVINIAVLYACQEFLLLQITDFHSRLNYSIAIQSVMTKSLSLYLHYIVANLVAIGVSSIFNFVANDKLTFRRSGGKGAP